MKTKRPIWLIILLNIYYNWRDRKRFNSKNFKKSAGHRHSKLSTQESIDYIYAVFNDYLKYGKINEISIKDKVVLELGPGDNFGVALLFLAYGAKKVICLDKFFYENKDRDKERKIYLAIRDTLSEEQQERFDIAVNLTDGIKFNDDKFEYITGTGAEDAEIVLGKETIDLIISRAVLEHLEKPQAALKGLDKTLKNDGLMIHQIDLKDHRIFSKYGWNPLTFLTIKNSTYHRMTKDAGRPNRKLANFYFNILHELNYKIDYYINDIFGNDKMLNEAKRKVKLGTDYSDDTLNIIKEIRPKLISEYQNVSDDIIMIAVIFITAQKKLNRD